jgi:purine-nucleoside phosphorylase
MSKTELDQSARLVAERTTVRPIVGVVLGSGLGAFGDLLEQRIAYRDLPGMPVSRVSGHVGNLRLGYVGEVAVACLQGRAHFYEGHESDAVVFGVLLLARLGCKAVLLTNAAGGIAPKLRPGDLLLIGDHLNLTGRSPAGISHGDGNGAPFTDMTDAYDPRLRALAHTAADDTGLALHDGVYAGMLGPTYETPAEIRMLGMLGADAVGMSTVVEVAALRQAGLRVAAIACITNLGAGLSPSRQSHSDVEHVAATTSKAFVALLSRWVVLVGKEVSR